MLPLAIATGDPAGVGPLVSLRALQSLGDVPAILFGDAAWLTREAASSGLELRQIATPADYREGIAAVSSATWADEVVQARAPTVEGGRAQLAALDAAITAVQDGRARALVTAPTSKEAVASTGMPFRGQTEHLARRAGQEQDSVTMMFAGPVLRVGLVTTHLSLLEVPQAITPVRVRRTIRHMSELLSRLDLEGDLGVTGLNPHAGEGGLLGREEIESLQPALSSSSDAGRRVVGPMPAESAFRAAKEGRLAGVVAMYHDQATVASKLLDWTRAVNVTWGLPFVRTSVDHGVAYDAARDGTADHQGMIAAIELARKLAPEFAL